MPHHVVHRSLRALRVQVIAGVVAHLISAPLAAEEPGATPAEVPPGDAAPVEAAPVEAAPVEAAPVEPVEAAPPAAGPSLPSVKLFGILKPTVVAGNALESFTFPTLVAPTAAGHPLFFADPDAPVGSFQLQQSRVGVRVGEGGPVSGVLEVDFVHFEQSSPVQQAFPRLRLAYVEVTALEGHKLVVGQGWDLFSPLVPHTFDLVAALFQSGNAAFLRPQATWLVTLGAIELGAAVGLAAPNPTPSVANLELGLAPSVALRAAAKTDGLSLAASVIGGMPRFTDAAGDTLHRVSAGGALSVEASVGPVVVRGEGYSGMNLANLGTLTLGTGHAGDDVFDTGGFVSTRVALHPWHALTAAAGGAFVANPQSMLLGYTPATATTPAIRAPQQGAGISRNVNVRVGYVFSPLAGLSCIVEPLLFYTRHMLAEGETVDGDRLAVGGEGGVRWDF